MDRNLMNTMSASAASAGAHKSPQSLCFHSTPTQKQGLLQRLGFCLRGLLLALRCKSRNLQRITGLILPTNERHYQENYQASIFHKESCMFLALAGIFKGNMSWQAGQLLFSKARAFFRSQNWADLYIRA